MQRRCRLLLPRGLFCIIFVLLGGIVLLNTVAVVAAPVPRSTTYKINSEQPLLLSEIEEINQIAEEGGDFKVYIDYLSDRIVASVERVYPRYTSQTQIRFHLTREGNGRMGRTNTMIMFLSGLSGLGTSMNSTNLFYFTYSSLSIFLSTNLSYTLLARRGNWRKLLESKKGEPLATSQLDTIVKLADSGAEFKVGFSMLYYRRVSCTLSVISDN